MAGALPGRFAPPRAPSQRVGGGWKARGQALTALVRLAAKLWRHAASRLLALTAGVAGPTTGLSVRRGTEGAIPQRALGAHPGTDPRRRRRHDASSPRRAREGFRHMLPIVAGTSALTARSLAGDSVGSPATAIAARSSPHLCPRRDTRGPHRARSGLGAATTSWAICRLGRSRLAAPPPAAPWCSAGARPVAVSGDDPRTRSGTGDPPLPCAGRDRARGSRGATRPGRGWSRNRNAPLLYFPCN